MLVAVDADGEERARCAPWPTLDAALARAPSAATGRAPRPPTTARSAAAAADATLALISTPGQYAFADALDALDAGLRRWCSATTCRSSRRSRSSGPRPTGAVLVMGPDCGTAVVGGVGLGFANVVRPGPVGLVAASGTGAQQLMCLLDGAGVGVTHCLGVGGRDLSAAVGGRSTLAGAGPARRRPRRPS